MAKTIRKDTPAKELSQALADLFYMIKIAADALCR